MSSSTPRADHDERIDSSAWRRWSVSPALIDLTRRGSRCSGGCAAVRCLRRTSSSSCHPARYQRHDDLHVCRDRHVHRRNGRGDASAFRPHHLHRDGAGHPPAGQCAASPAIHASSCSSATARPCCRACSSSIRSSGALLARRPLHGREHRPRHGGQSGAGPNSRRCSAHPVRRHLVLIDDARLFTGTAGYPTIEELRGWIARERPGSACRSTTTSSAARSTRKMPYPSGG